MGGKQGKKGHMNSSSLNPVALISPFKHIDAYKTPSHNQPCWNISHTKIYAFVYNDMAKNKNCLAQGCQTFCWPEYHWGKHNRIMLITQHCMVNSVPVRASEWKIKSIKVTTASVWNGRSSFFL